MAKNSQAIERAAKALRSAVLDLGHNQAKLETYLADVVGHGAARRVRLSPIATEGLPSAFPRGRVVVTGKSGFLIRATELNVGNGEITFPIRTATVHALPTRRMTPRRTTREPRVLVVPNGLEDFDLHVFPVVDLSPRGCAIDAGHAIPPGTQLESTELWGERKLLRRANATIIETIPWRTPEGYRRFRMRVVLETPTSAPLTPSDRLSDPERIKKLLSLVNLMGVPVEIELPEGHTHTGQITTLDSDSLVVETKTPLISPRLRMSFELFASNYAMDVRTLGRSSSDAVAVTYPLLVSRRRRRHQSRARVPNELAVGFEGYNAATGDLIRREVLDLSFSGLSFRTVPAEDVLWTGLVLERAKIRWRGSAINVGDLEIRNVDEVRGICRGAMRANPSHDSPAMVDLIARLTYPDLSVDDGANFDEFVDLYQRVGLFGPHMDRNLPPVLEAAGATWTRMHKTALCRTIVQEQDDKPVAAVSAVRGWEKTWVIQHMVAAPGRRHRDPGVLHRAHLDYVLPRADGQYIAAFVKADNSRVTGFFERFLALNGTPEAMGVCTVGLWIRRGGTPAPPLCSNSDLKLRKATQRDEGIIQRGAERLMGPLCTAVLSMREGELSLPNTTREYRNGGVQRSRANYVITRKGYPIAALVEEHADPGFNLTWMLNATWVIPLHTRYQGDALRLAASFVANAPTEAATEDRFLILPHGVDAGEFTRVGYRLEADVRLHGLHRAGLHRYYYFIRERYGEIAAGRLSRSVLLQEAVGQA